MNTFLIFTCISAMVLLNYVTDCCTVCDWSCGDGSCIPMKGRCDSSPDCADGSDEVHCPGKLCPEGLILCQHRNGSQFCIRVGTKCDSVSNTTDNGTAATSPTNTICSTPISTLNVLDTTTGDVANPDTLPTWKIIVIALAVIIALVLAIIILAVCLKMSKCKYFRLKR